jgi:hypothetical protein
LRRFLVAGGHAPEVLELLEEALDQEVNANPNETRECVLVRSDNEAVVVNITDVDPVEKPETVYWVDPIHKHPG